MLATGDQSGGDKVERDRSARGPTSRLAVLIWAYDRPERWLETFQSACRLDHVDCIHFLIPAAGTARFDKFQHPLALVEAGVSLGSACQRLMDAAFDQIFVVISPIIFSASALKNASSWIDADPRIGTVSFLSNAAGYLSFPFRNTEHPVGPAGHNEETLTKLLRELGPKADPTPIPVCEGGGVLIGRSALNASGGLISTPDANPQFVLAEFALRAMRRGFNSFLDTTTFISRPWDLIEHRTSILSKSEERHALFCEHHFFPGLHDHERDRSDSTLAQALDLARAKQQGLRILVDASELGAQQMGTQVLTLSMSTALARHPAVQSVVMAVPDPTNIPAYAQSLRSTEKISFVPAGGLDFPGAPHVDIIHRPYQPSRPIPWNRWRDLAKRSVITVQDVIGYRNGAYHQNWETWAHYRSNFRSQVGQADGIFCISQDVISTVRQEQLPVDRSRLFLVENGVDHLSSDMPTEIPPAFIERGLQAASFVVVLGTTYAHKNRDLGVRIWEKLVERGHRIALVLAGANVPCGTNRLEEAAMISGKENALVLPDVSERERNWLLRHASLVLYPTSAEGFGLVPFEAAQMGCPCLHVSFGPLREFLGSDERPEAFDVEELVDAAARLLSDSDARRRNIIRALAVRDELSWKVHAAKAVEAYFQILGNGRR